MKKPVPSRARAVLATAAPMLFLWPVVLHGAPLEEVNVRPVYLIPGDYVELELAPEKGALQKAGGKSPPYAIAQIEFDKLDGEHMGVVYRADTEVYVTVHRLDPKEKGQRPGWKVIGGHVSKPDAGGAPATYTTRYQFGTKPAGRFRFEFQVLKPGTAGRLGAYLVRAPMREGESKDLAEHAYARWEYERWQEIVRVDFPRATRTPLAIAEAVPGRRVRSPVPPVHTAMLDPDGVAWVQTKPERLRPFYAALYADGEHNAVLNFQKLGLAAMEAGEFATAERAFDEALHRIETIFVKDSAAAAARSTWANEAIKDFKGEPYERAMAYFYRGLLYLRAGDYDNARASFASAEYQDTVSEAEEYQGDFALMTWLAGWSARCAGSGPRADESFAAAETIDATLKRPADGDDWLYVAELGSAPVKVRRGDSGQILYLTWPMDYGDAERASVHVANGTPRELATAADLVFQATTRGGRPIDGVLRGKVAFQSATGTSGYLLLQAAQAIPLLALPAIAITAVAGQTETEADIRTWDTLPGRIALSTGAGAAGAAPAFAYTGVDGARSAPWLHARAGRCGISWSRSRSVLAAGPGVPGNDAALVEERSKNREAAARDAAFRAALRDGGH